MVFQLYLLNINLLFKVLNDLLQRNSSVFLYFGPISANYRFCWLSYLVNLRQALFLCGLSDEVDGRFGNMHFVHGAG